MKRLVIFIPFLLFADILSDIKKKEINFDRLKSIASSKETKNSWINPVILKYSYKKDNMNNMQTTTNLFSISINQPIFKSGAIYYSIKYANLSKEYNINRLEIQKRKLIKEAFDLVYDYKIAILKKKILIKQIENAKINLKRKKEAFLSGVGNSNELDNALLNLNSLKLSLEDLNTQIITLKNHFSNLSDLNIDKVVLPKFKLASKERFLNENIELLSAEKLKKIKNYLYKMQIGNQLVTISLNGSLNYQKKHNKMINDKQNYYTAGISIILPLDINAKTKIEKTKLDYLKSIVLIEDKKRSLINEYKNTLYQIDSLKRKISIYQENLKIYENLIESTKDSIIAGNATQLDLEVLSNSKVTNLINIKILNLKIQKTLLNLYYKLVSFSNN